MIRRPPRSTLFPTRRSSDLSGFDLQRTFIPTSKQLRHRPSQRRIDRSPRRRNQRIEIERRLDRKSTRLNSSHSQISYAVFCLKKKKKKKKNKKNKKKKKKKH